MAKKRSKGKGRRRGPTMAERADRHELYEQSVQNVEEEVRFLRKTFRRHRGRAARVLREDFCGTAAAACAWVKRHSSHEAVGVDIDGDVLDYGRRRHVASLSKGQRERVRLVEGNVLTARTPPADILVAFNFSYWCFEERTTLLKYFRRARKSLSRDGLFIFDVFGGSDAYDECEEETKHNGFTYVWDQASYDPITGHCQCYIHFRFPDGSKLEPAFSYEWRLWGLPELLEVAAEAGFANTTVYWQGEDEDGEPNGVFKPAKHGEPDPAWIAYVVCEA